MTANAIIKALDLRPHPEGGWYRQTWIADSTRPPLHAGGTEDNTDNPQGPGTGAGPSGQRPTGTAIIFLLKKGERSHWHQVEATEIWHFYAGDPLILSTAQSDQSAPQDHILGPDVLSGESPQLIVPAHHWQAAETQGDYTLVGCTVSPAFRFDGFSLVPPAARGGH